MLNYIPLSTPAINSIRKDMMHRIDIHPDDISLLAGDDTPELAENPGECNGSDILDRGVGTDKLDETMGYSPAFANFSSPISDTNRDNTDLNKNNPSSDPLLKTDEGDTAGGSMLDDNPEEMVHYVPSEIVDYYNEAALTSKARNNLPDSEFGLPRLRAYPLNDKQHVRQAIRMFGHCKDPKDRATLAKNIFKKVEEFGLDVKIGKNNPLHDYAPKSLQEAAGDERVSVYGLAPTGKRTKDDVVREHLQRNSLFYHHIFYGNDFARSVAALEEYSFFGYFYPNFSTHNFYSRIKTTLGGLGMNREVYDELGIRYPLETDFTKPLGWVSPENVDNFELTVQLNYSSDVNWFNTNTANDIGHIFYCIRLYSILGDIMNNPNFNMEDLTDMHIGILTDWGQRVVYHYDLLQETEVYSAEYIREAQYLHDLFWNCNENPLDKDSICAAIISMISQMTSADNLVTNMNESGELIGKEDCAAYLVKELGLDDDVFILPDTLEFPVINKSGVRFAMDCIRRVPKDQIKEFSMNLNRKYRELGCTFSISVDHPYAQYADQTIIDNMNRILMEGDTAVSDAGTSAATSEVEPWYKRLDQTDGRATDFYPNRELGPNEKKNKQDFSRFDSVL